MKVIADIADLRRHLTRVRPGRRVCFVPTMGALHDGHHACVNAARRDDGINVVSIFVNPTQFGAGEDLARYPRTLDHDLVLCRQWGVDVVFAPSVADMYPSPQTVWVDVAEFAAQLCGAFRPGHFRAVATVVVKLFHVVAPDIAGFGQKDAQQALIVRDVVRQLALPVTLHLAPTVRESDGLALSSRNARLDPQSRAVAPAIFRALRDAASALESGERRPRQIESAARVALNAAGIADVDYVELRSAADLSTLERADGRVILAVAARLGGTRLIDNMVFDIANDVVRADVGLFE